MKKVYEDVRDIDVYAGMIMENVEREDEDDGAAVGSTLKCIIGDTFARLRFGDRFFYDNKDQPGSFTPDQLAQIRKASMARILCDNTNGKIATMQPKAFEPFESDINPRLGCNSRFLNGIPRMDMTVFKE